MLIPTSEWHGFLWLTISGLKALWFLRKCIIIQYFLPLNMAESLDLMITCHWQASSWTAMVNRSIRHSRHCQSQIWTIQRGILVRNRDYPNTELCLRFRLEKAKMSWCSFQTLPSLHQAFSNSGALWYCVHEVYDFYCGRRDCLAKKNINGLWEPKTNNGSLNKVLVFLVSSWSYSKHRGHNQRWHADVKPILSNEEACCKYNSSSRDLTDWQTDR